MSALAKIRSAGFEAWLKDNGNIGIKPFDALTPQQLEFLKVHKAEIVKELAVNGTTEPAPATDPLLVEVWTPSGTSMTIRADDAEHAAWLQRMNPKPKNPAPKPDLTPEPGADRISEAEHSAQGRFFKFLATWADGRQCYLCQMPRQTVDEMREQFPDAATIQPIENEDYTDDE
jgi:hypothetical protein